MKNYANLRKKINNIVAEEVKMFETYSAICDVIILKERTMKNAGYSRRQINENIDIFLEKIKELGPSFGDYIQQHIARMALGNMGINTDSVFGYALVNMLGEVDVTEITKYVGDDACRELAEVFVDGIIEGLAEFGMDKIIQVLLGTAFGSGPHDPTTRQMDGVFSGTMREEINEVLKKYINKHRLKFIKFICDLDWEGIAQGVKDALSGKMPETDIFSNISDKLDSAFSSGEEGPGEEGSEYNRRREEEIDDFIDYLGGSQLNR